MPIVNDQQSPEKQAPVSQLIQTGVRDVDWMLKRAHDWVQEQVSLEDATDELSKKINFLVWSVMNLSEWLDEKKSSQWSDAVIRANEIRARRTKEAANDSSYDHQKAA